MNRYEASAYAELRQWQQTLIRKPSTTSRLAQTVQDKINRFIPEKAQRVIAEAIKHMIRAVLFGSEFISGRPLLEASLEEREKTVRVRINSYKKMAAAGGAWIGAGGFLLGLADLPVLLSLKMKLLFDVAGLYGINVTNYQERIFILYIFQLAFSGPERKVQVYAAIENWEEHRKSLPADMNDFDWRTFQQEYRDYIDVAKMLQLIPGIGAVVGAYANHQLVDKLGETAINAYRLRYFSRKDAESIRKTT